MKEKIEKFKALGSNLKQRRSEMNVSLKEVENATSVRMSYLQAIEEGEVAKLISPVYAQGFIKQYAAFLGLDGERLVREHSELFSPGESQKFVYGIGTMEMRGNPGAGVKWFPNAVWVGLFVAILIAAWYLAKVLEVV